MPLTQEKIKAVFLSALDKAPAGERAADEALEGIVAIKVLAPRFAAIRAARQRFAQEARAAARVIDDNVITIYSVDESGPVPFMVMPLVSGQSLQEKLDRTGTLPLGETLRIGWRIAKGLAAAHRHGLVHGDVKPANILLENGIERVKLSDFGLARPSDDASPTRSSANLVAGTPTYMSPEQALGEPVDCRSDLFSLGSVCTPCVRASHPFADRQLGRCSSRSTRNPRGRSRKLIRNCLGGWEI
jgi:serine/threonine protein kinase